MKILIYGAGPLGSFLAGKLKLSGQEVSLLARGKRLDDLRKYGLVIEDPVTKVRRKISVPVVEKLSPTDMYDWIIVVMGKHDLPAVLPVISKNYKVPNVLFIGNNVSGGRDLAVIVGYDRVLLGFLMAAGKLAGEVAVVGNYFDGQISPSMIGELDGSVTSRLIEIAAIFENAGLPVEVSRKIESWLKCHAATIVPMAGAYFLAGNNLGRLASTPDAIVMMVRGIHEALQILHTYHIPFLPARLNLLYYLPEPFMVALTRKRLENPLIRYAFVHADKSRPEISELGCELIQLARSAELVTPHLDSLVVATRTDRYEIPAGSQRLSLNWRGVWVPLIALIAAFWVFLSVNRWRDRQL